MLIKMPTMLLIRNLVEKTVAVLLALALGIAALPASITVASDREVTAFEVISCNCCKSSSANCATPSCCTAPTSQSSPVAPAGLPSAQGERQAMVAELCFALTPLSFPYYKHCFPATLLPGPRTVPIFQRDCSYLI